MDNKTGDLHRYKRKIRGEDEEKWDCSVCTYMNPKESYKCEMCHTRKGTSTRKPRINTQVVEQQQLIAQTILREKDEEHKRRKETRNNKSCYIASSFRLKNYDRSSPLRFEVFANGYTVVITEYQPKSLKSKVPNYSLSQVPSNCSSNQGLTGVHSSVPSEFSTESVGTTYSRQRPVHNTPYSEYNFPESVDIKPSKSSYLHSFGFSRPDDNHPPYRSYSSASSSVGGVTLSRTSSPPNALNSCLSEVKREQGAIQAEQAAQDGDDEYEDEDDKSNRICHRKQYDNEFFPEISSAAGRCRKRPGVSSINDTSSTISSRDSSVDSHLRSRPLKARKVADTSLSPTKRKRLNPVCGRGAYHNSSRRHVYQAKLRQTSTTDLKSPRPYRSQRVEQHVPSGLSEGRNSMRKAKKQVRHENLSDIRLRKCPRITSSIKTNINGASLCMNQKNPSDVVTPIKQIDLNDTAVNKTNTQLEMNEINNSSDSPVRPRLSADSKNTSAMTDSGGATVLEISS